MSDCSQSITPDLTESQLDLLREIDRRSGTGCPLLIFDLPAKGYSQHAWQALKARSLVTKNGHGVIFFTPGGRRALADAKGA